jgi:serine/threonine-protein kinase ATR
MRLLRFQHLLFFLFVFTFESLTAQFDPHAGIIPSYTEGAIVSVSSITPTSFVEHIIDGDDGTFWQSGGALPTGFLIRQDLNILLGLGGTPASTNSGGLPDSVITDASVYTGLQIPQVSGKAWVEIDLGGVSPFRSLSLKGIVGADSISIWIFHSAGDSLKLGAYTSVDNYNWKHISLIDTITKVRLESTNQFTLTEVGARAEIPTEYAVIDLGSIKNIGVLETRHFTGSSVTASEILLSSDSISWTKVADLDPLALTLISNRLPAEIPARYIKLKHTMVEANWNKANIWEIRAYDKYGRYGPFPSPSTNTHTLSEMLGVNGIWGWGHGVYSDLLASDEGAFKYSPICAHARNYHNMSWDVSDPDIVPDFDGMPGSLAQWWLDWDREYEVWNTAGLDVSASIQFSNSIQPESSWDDPYQAAYNYGFAFAEHFGPGVGNGLVKRIEVGNEPWDYEASFYREVLQGMAEGAKAADPSLLVFPCALQAADSSAESGNYLNYAGVRLLDTIAPYIDGLNVHYYSYYNDSTGTRRATYPENYISSMRGILNDLRYRDANFPGKKMFVSEWGWDSDGAGEACTHNECVSETAQAIYGVRYAMMLSRLGVDDMTWFFYANGNNSSSLYTRSGLTGSSATSFLEKKSFIAFEALLHHIGDDYFLDTLVENDDYWVYLFGDSTGTPTYLVGWRPVDESDGNISSISIPIAYAPDSAWTISGLSGSGTDAPLPTYSGGNMTLSLSGVPLVVKLQGTPVVSASYDIEEKITVYPNPTTGDVFIQGYDLLKGNIVLRDCLGGVVRHWEGVNEPINIADLPQGIYFLTLNYMESSTVVRIAKVE